MNYNVKLTHYSKGAGWACKIGAKELTQVLSKLNLITNNDIESGFNDFDDCAIYKINEQQSIIQTVDFFTPIVDDPYTFGAIAAANSFSDIYAMGGKPIFALNITCFPTEDLPLDILHQILKGGQDVANDAGAPILGGHSIKDKEPKYGMVVTGIVKKEQLVRNDNAQIGDVLILTKPIGTGIISTAIKKGTAPKKAILNAIQSMSLLNKKAAEGLKNLDVHSVTDVTGFGLLGHLKEMCQNSNVSSEIYFSELEFLPSVIDLAEAGFIPGGTKKNLKCVKEYVKFYTNISDTKKKQHRICFCKSACCPT